jgi:hypothetical protein
MRRDSIRPWKKGRKTCIGISIHFRQLNYQPLMPFKPPEHLYPGQSILFLAHDWHFSNLSDSVDVMSPLTSMIYSMTSGPRSINCLAGSWVNFCYLDLCGDGHFWGFQYPLFLKSINRSSSITCCNHQLGFIVTVHSATKVMICNLFPALLLLSLRVLLVCSILASQALVTKGTTTSV